MTVFPSTRWKRLFRAAALVGFPLLAAALLLSSCGWFKPAFDPQKFGTTEQDVTYCTVGGVALPMDIYYPASGGPWPALIYVHGGSWAGGDKDEVDSAPASLGYLVVSVNYRLAPEYLFPAMIEDLKCAVRFLRAHARDYNLDAGRIALFGHSAGAQLVALAGLADESAGWDVGEYLEESSRVQAVAVIGVLADLQSPYPDWLQTRIQYVFGADRLAAASPLTYITADDPPFCVLHGEADPVVPVEQAVLFNNALLQAGISSELLLVQNGGHSLEPLTGETAPSTAEAYQAVYACLAAALEGAP